jgi:hypothetical protein
VARKNAKSTLKEEVDGRLEDLFGEDGDVNEAEAEVQGQAMEVEAAPIEGPRVEDKGPGQEDIVFADLAEPSESKSHEEAAETSPLKHLHALILSMDWEITDVTMEEFIRQTEDLRAAYPNDKLLLLLLQGMASVGQYIKNNKGKAHPSASAVLTSLYRGLEAVVLTEDMPELEKKRIVVRELEKFKAFKGQVASGQKPTHERAAVTPDDLREALAEMRQFIQSQFESLRSEIAALIKGQERV